jgi:glycerophosphoryl diester phosphodiesterase
VKIYAHRGASADFPESTRTAYLGAIDQGADGFECDLRVTRDGTLVIWHDRDLKRIAGSGLSIAGSTYDQLNAIYPIITLNELLDLAIETKKDLALETKHPVPTRGLVEDAIAALLHQRAAEIEASGIDIVLMSFSWRAVNRARRLGLATVLLAQWWLPLKIVATVIGRGARPCARRYATGPSINALRKYPKIARYHGRTFVWTVDTDADAELCHSLGVDVIITNRPGAIRKGLIQ